MKKIIETVRKDRKFLMVLTIVSILAFVFSLFLARNQQIWFDESYSVLISKDRTFAETLKLTSVDAHPPLYYFALKIWAAVGGWGDLWLRSLSSMFFAVSIFVAGIFAKRLFGDKSAILASSMLVFSPFLLRYSYEIRMYSLASLIAISSTALFFEIWKGSKSRKIWMAYALIVATGMYTLYTLALVFFAHFLLMIWREIKHKNANSWKENWFKSYFLAVILYIPWLPSFFYQLKNSASAGIGRKIDFEQFVNAFDFTAVYKPISEVPLFISIILMIATVVIFTIWIKTEKFSKNSRFLLSVAFLPILISVVLSQFSPFFVERYIAQFIIFAYLGLSLAMVRIFEKSNRIIYAILAVLIVCSSTIGILNVEKTGNFNYQNYRLSNARDNAELLATFCQKTPVITDDVYLFMELKVYNSQCDLRIFTPNDGDYGGGYATINGVPERVVGEIPFKEFIAFSAPSKRAEFATERHQEVSKDLPKFENLKFQYFESR